MKQFFTAVTTAVLILCVGISVSAQDIFEEEGSLYSTRQLGGKAVVVSGSKVVIESASTLQGSLRITVTDDDRALVKYFKKAKADKRSRAEDYIDLISVNLEKMPGGIKLVLRAPNPAPWEGTETGSVEAHLQIPAACEVEINAQYFDVEAEGPFRTFIVPTSLGRFDVTLVTEELDLSTSNRRVNVENVSGEIAVSTTNSDLVARNIKAYGGRADIRNDGGDIQIFGISGEINVKNSYGRIDIDGFAATGKKNTVRGVYGPIAIAVTEMGEGRLVVSNRFEDIDLAVPSDISAVWSLAVEENGKIEVANLTVTPDLVQQNRLNLVSGKGKAFIDGSVRGEGNVYVRGYNPED